MRVRRLRDRLGGHGPTKPRPWLILLCAALLGACSADAPIAGVFAATAIGALLGVNAAMPTRVLTVFLAATLLIEPAATARPLAFWLILALTTSTAIAPRKITAVIWNLPQWTWHVAKVTAAASICVMLLSPTWIATCLALLSAFYVGASVARGMALNEARLLSWGDEGLVSVTRDLLLGRVTSGMLHDLAQPLNVISMANGNMGYIAEHLAIDEEERRQLLDRVERIAQHTQSAGTILSLFRWFGRDGSDDPAQLTVRSALERAVAATRSNVRHHDVAVELQGQGLEYLLPSRHGYLEMIAVGVLLCAFASFIAPDGAKKRGTVVLQATLSPANVTISVQCIDEDGQAIHGKVMDNATAWLIDQVAREAAGDVRSFVHVGTPEHFLIRLGRDDT